MKKDVSENRFRFTKMEGLGNDYVYAEEFGAMLRNAPEIARLVSDRHFGIGADGLILIGDSDKADFRMRMFNADGSEGEMCGNGIRCVGKYVYDHGLTLKTTVTIETLAGVRTLRLTLAGGKVRLARVDMGPAILEPEKIPLDAPGKDFIDREIVVDGKTYRGTAVSMGNPHCVVFVDNVDSLDLEAIRVMDTRSALRVLTGLEGVGLKVASCVLLFGVIRPSDAQLLPGGGKLSRLMYRLGLWKKDERVRRV